MGAATSVAAVWAVAARHQRTASLEAYWRHAFIDLSSAGGAARWVANYLVQVGDYGTTSLGLPLAVLAAGGLAELWHRCRPLVLLLAGPPAVALVPNALGLYPLDDRLLFFAAPCVWLAAAAGVDGVGRRLRGRGAWVGVLALAALHLPGAVLVGKNLVTVEPKAEYREAFDFVRREGGAALRTVAVFRCVAEGGPP